MTFKITKEKSTKEKIVNSIVDEIIAEEISFEPFNYIFKQMRGKILLKLLKLMECLD